MSGPRHVSTFSPNIIKAAFDIIVGLKSRDFIKLGKVNNKVGPVRMSGGGVA